MRVVLSDPADATRVADEFVKSDDTTSPISIIGFSLGAKAAEALATRFQVNDPTVRTLVLIDGSSLTPISSNVENAVNFYLEGDRIEPSYGFAGTLRNIDVRAIAPESSDVHHMNMTRYKFLQDRVIAEVLGGDKVDASARPPRLPTDKPHPAR